MRTFIAIQLPEEIQKKLLFLQNSLKECKAIIKWVDPGNIHLTLKFLGEINLDNLQKVIRETEYALRDKLTFHITISTLGTFPDPNYPKVIWVGIKEGGINIQNIAYALEEKLGKMGIPEEKNDFFCHITIGRIKSLVNKSEIIDRIRKLNSELINEEIKFSAEKVTIFKSRLTPNGPIYEALKEITLKTA